MSSSANQVDRNSTIIKLIKISTSSRTTVSKQTQLRGTSKATFSVKAGSQDAMNSFHRRPKKPMPSKLFRSQALLSKDQNKKYSIGYIQLMSEIKIHESLSNKNIVKFLHNFEDNLNVYIVLELCTNKVLFI